MEFFMDQPDSTWKKSFNALMVGEFLAIVGFSTTTPTIPLYLRELGMTDPVALNWWTGAINGLSSLMIALMAPVWGSLADSVGRKPMVLRAMFGGAITLGFLGITNSAWQVLALKLLQGMLTGTVAAATVLTTTIVPKKEIGYRLGLMQMAIFSGNSVGPLIGGVVTDLAGSRANFVITGVLLFGAGLVVRRFVYEDFKPAPRTTSLLRAAIPDLGVLRTNEALRPLMIAIFVVQFANAIATPIIPLVILDMSIRAGAAMSGAGTGSLSGMVIGIAAGAAALGSVAVGRISGRVGFGRALFICLAGAFVFYVPQGFVQSPWILMGLRALSGFFMGGTMPTANALIADRAEEGRQGAIYGLSSSVSSMGNALGPAFGALLASGLGYPFVFFATAALLGVLGMGVGRTVGVTLKSR